MSRGTPRWGLIGVLKVSGRSVRGVSGTDTEDERCPFGGVRSYRGTHRSHQEPQRLSSTRSGSGHIAITGSFNIEPALTSKSGRVNL